MVFRVGPAVLVALARWVLGPASDQLAGTGGSPLEQVQKIRIVNTAGELLAN